MSKFSDATLYLAPSGYKEGILFPQKPLSTNGEISFTRASSAWRTNIEGQVEEVCYNLAQYSEEFDNGYWNKSFGTLTTNVINAPNGTLTADLFTKTSGVNTVSQVLRSGSVYLQTGIHTLSVYAKQNVGNLLLFRLDNNDNTANAQWNFSTKSFTNIGANIISSSFEELSNGWFRLIVTGNVISTTWSVSIANLFANPTNDSVYIWGAQLVQGSLPRPYLSTTNRQNFPRVDYSLGTGTFLLEPQRTNSIRNSTAVGAVAGSPGTLPTYWNFSPFGGAGFTRTVVGVGTENGLPYIDIRLDGTATGTAYSFFTENSASASASQVFANSVYLKFAENPNPPNSASIVTNFFNGGTFVNSQITSVAITTNLTRFTGIHTASSSTVTVANSFISFNFTIGTAYDFTIRIAAPQLELGAYPTSPILTSTVAVTRIADSFSRGNIFTNNLISSSGGTWFVDLKNNLSVTNTTTDRGIFIGDTNTGIGNALNVRRLNAGRLQITKVVGGSTGLLYTTTTDALKIAIKWNGTSVDVFENGVKVTSASPFTTTNMEFLATRSGEEPYQNISQMALWRTPLTDAQCQELTL